MLIIYLLIISPVLALLVRPIVKLVVLKPEKSRESYGERLLLTIYGLLIALITLEGIIAVLPLTLLISLIMPKRRIFLHRSGRFWTKFFLWMLCVKAKIEGKENLPVGPAIYVQNFSTYLDGAATLAYLPIDFRFVFLRHLFEIPFLGWLERMMGYLALEGEVVSVMHDDVLEVLKALSRGENIVASTEGKEVKGGVILFALQSKLPLVPLAIKHTLTSPAAGGFFIKPYPREMIIKVKKPILTAEMTDDHLHRQEIKKRVQDEL